MSEGDRYPYNTGNVSSARKFQHHHPPAERVKNQFANDGSFLEMFKKRMVEEQMKASAQISDDNSNSNSRKNNTTTPEEVTSTSNDEKIMRSARLSSDNLSNINNIRATITPPTTTTTNPLKSGLLPLVGKRRSDLRRSLKTGIVKKLRIDPSDTADHSTMNASSKYMEEVKRYKATMCVEDEKSRPLVK